MASGVCKRPVSAKSTPRRLLAPLASGGLDKSFEVFNRRISVNTMAEINNMMLPAACRQAVSRCLGHSLRRAFTQQFLIHIPLHHEVGINASDGGQVVTRSDADNFGAALSHQVHIGALLDEKNS